MPQTIRTTGDRGLDRELDALRDALRRVSSVPSPASPGTIERSPFGPYVRSVSEQGNTGASGDITFTDSGGTEITQADQNFDFYSPPLCDDPPEDVGAVIQSDVLCYDWFEGTNGDTVTSGGTHATLESGGTWKSLDEVWSGSMGWSAAPLSGQQANATEGYRVGAIVYDDTMPAEVSLRGSFSRRLPFNDTERIFGLIARAVGGSTPAAAAGYWAGYIEWDNGTSFAGWAIYKFGASDWPGTALATSASHFSNYDDLMPIHLEFRVSNTSKELWVDGVQVCTTADNTLPGSTAATNRSGWFLDNLQPNYSPPQDSDLWVDNFGALNIGAAGEAVPIRAVDSFTDTQNNSISVAFPGEHQRADSGESWFYPNDRWQFKFPAVRDIDNALFINSGTRAGDYTGSSGEHFASAGILDVYLTAEHSVFATLRREGATPSADASFGVMSRVFMWTAKEYDDGVGDGYGYGYVAGWKEDVGWFIGKYVSGELPFTVLDSEAGSMTVNTNYSLEFRVTDSLKSLYVDSVLKCTTSNNDYPGSTVSTGRTGMWTDEVGESVIDDVTVGFYIDDFRVEPVISTGTNQAGDSTYMSRCDHVHEGVHSIARRTAYGTAGTALTGDVVLQEDGGIVLNETVASSRVKIAEGFWRDLLTMGI